MRRAPLLCASALLAASLASAGLAQQAPPPTPLPAIEVTARGETVPVGTAAEDAADDAAIWLNPRNGAASLILATDKRAGLYVYDMDGQVRDFVPAGRVNNVDLIDMGSRGVIVVASDRNDVTRALLQVYRLNTASRKLEHLGAMEGGAGEAYGVCLLRRGSELHAFSVLKHGLIEHVSLTIDRNKPVGRSMRSLKLETQTEGCVTDPRTGTLYVGEEDRGIWSFDARTDGSAAGTLVAPVDGRQLVADVEGLALMPEGRDGGWLIASSQGDNAYALYALPGMTPAGRFRIAQGRFGATQETDGIAAARGHFGADYPDGLFVAQDGDNAPAAQNFKLVSWRDILRALRD